MKMLLLWLVLITAALTPARAQDPAPNDPNAPWDRSGTAAGALINGVQSSLRRAELGGADGAVTIPSIAQRYNETYGPYLKGIGFDMTKFMGTPQRRGVIFGLIKIGFTIALILTFVGVAFKANKGQATVSDVGWSMSKAGIGALVVLFPGGLYAILVIFPVALSSFIAHSDADATLDPNSTVAMRAESAMNAGFTTAAAVVNGGMASLNQDDPFATLAAYNLAEALKEFAKKAQIQSRSVDGIILPEKGADGEFIVFEKTKERTNEKPKVAIPLGAVTEMKTRFKEALDEMVAQWRLWPLPEIEGLAKTQAAAEKELSLRTNDSEQTAMRLRELRLEAYNGMLPILREQLLRRKAAGVQPSKAVDKEADRLFAEGKMRAIDFINANKAKTSTSETIINGVSNFMLSFLMPAISAVWMFAIEILMIQMLVMTAFWIHPRTEAAALKAAKTLLGVAFFLPVYLIAFMAVQKLLGVLMPGDPLAAAASTGHGLLSGVVGAVTKVVSALTWPMRAMWAVTYAILSPLLALPCAWFMLKALKSGGTLVGGFAKMALTSVGAAATMTMPMLRGATMAASAGLSAAAGGMAASGAASSSMAGKSALNGAAWATRRLASAANFTESTLGKAFGVNDKYMNRSMTAKQNLAGGVAAMKAAAGGSLEATMSGGRASDIIAHVERKATEHEHLRAKPGNESFSGGSGGKSPASELQLLEAQRQQAAAQSKAMDKIGELVEKLDRVAAAGNHGAGAAATKMKKPEEPPPAPSPGQSPTPRPPSIPPSGASADLPVRLHVDLDHQMPAAVAARMSARVTVPGEASPRAPAEIPPPPRINLSDLAGRN